MGEQQPSSKSTIPRHGEAGNKVRAGQEQQGSPFHAAAEARRKMRELARKQK